MCVARVLEPVTFQACVSQAARARDQFWADWERIAFDMESIRKSYAMVDTKDLPDK